MSRKRSGKNRGDAGAMFPPAGEAAERDAADVVAADAGGGAAEAEPEGGAEAEYRRLREQGRSTKQIRAAAARRGDDGLVELCDAILEGRRGEPGQPPPDGEGSTAESDDKAEPDGNDDPDAEAGETAPEDREPERDGDGGDGEDGDPEEDGPAFNYRTNEEPLEYFYARRAEGVTIARLRAGAEKDGDGDVLELCDRMEAVESGLPRFTAEPLAEIEGKLDTFRARMKDCEESMHAAKSLLWDCLRAYARESGRAPRRARSAAVPRPAGTPGPGAASAC